MDKQVLLDSEFGKLADRVKDAIRKMTESQTIARKNIYDLEAALSASEARVKELEEFISPMSESGCQYPGDGSGEGFIECGDCWPCRAKKLLTLTPSAKSCKPREGCDEGHIKIYYQGGGCPICAIRKDFIDEMGEKEEEVEELKGKINDLETENEELHRGE